MNMRQKQSLPQLSELSAWEEPLPTQQLTFLALAPGAKPVPFCINRIPMKKWSEVSSILEAKWELSFRRSMTC